MVGKVSVTYVGQEGILALLPIYQNAMFLPVTLKKASLPLPETGFSGATALTSYFPIVPPSWSEAEPSILRPQGSTPFQQGQGTGGLASNPGCKTPPSRGSAALVHRVELQ